MQTYKIKNEIFVGFIPKLTQLQDFDWGSEDLFERKLVNKTLGQKPLSSSKLIYIFKIFEKLVILLNNRVQQYQRALIFLDFYQIISNDVIFMEIEL